MGKDFYKILGKSTKSQSNLADRLHRLPGLSKGASDDEIKKAYRKL